MRLLAALLTLATAVPCLAATAPEAFFLRVTSSNQQVNSKCVSAYHTGAGTADAVMFDCGPAPQKLFTFTNSTIQFTGYGEGISSYFLADSGVVSYNNWGFVVINGGDPSRSTPMTYNATSGFLQKRNGLGFIACRWAHDNMFQLFALGDPKATLPCSCTRVKLLKGCYNTDPGCNA
ncbi:hypothetical protein B0I35DRAFT_434377 [Stachybotrys elegans]|uniref:DUF7907 domain-containing protein n=1 Tax=Stachybotrys elegans TaxID=80388 RepID=A0A8K0STR4_9HYPO|nr:hypothetical protein B0I35DRAFT_434377 [Stachybotrys elegans]